MKKIKTLLFVSLMVFRDGRIDFENLHKLMKETGKEKLVLDLSLLLCFIIRNLPPSADKFQNIFKFHRPSEQIERTADRHMNRKF